MRDYKMLAYINIAGVRLAALSTELLSHIQQGAQKIGNENGHHAPTIGRKI
jgi:hypothetical protein